MPVKFQLKEFDWPASIRVRSHGVIDLRKKPMSLGRCALSLVIGILAGAPSASGGTAASYLLATGAEGSTAYRAGVGLTSLIKVKLLPGDGIDLEALSTEDGIDNVRRLQESGADLAILPAPVAHAARTASGPFAGDPPERGLRGIAVLWQDAVHFVVRAEDNRDGTVADFGRVGRRPVDLGRPGGAEALASRLLLEQLGLDPAVATGGSRIDDLGSALANGEIGGFSLVERPPATVLDALFADPTRGRVRLLDIGEAEMAMANRGHWLWTPYIIPAGTYPGQTETVRTFGMANMLVAKAETDEDTIYRITRAIFENLDYLARVDRALADLHPAHALAGLSLPLHPGALRFYQEQGVGALLGSMQEVYPGDDMAAEALTEPGGSGGPLAPAIEPPKDAPETEPNPWHRRAVF
jgi:TRAP transporter TAXI family solute receptor